MLQWRGVLRQVWDLQSRGNKKICLRLLQSFKKYVKLKIVEVVKSA